MTDEDKKALAAAITTELCDSAEGLRDPELLAGLIVDRIEPVLHQQGWMPPETTERLHAWGQRLGELPEHHIGRDALNSHLCELWGIL
jgi:hypothetical protein